MLATSSALLLISFITCILPWAGDSWHPNLPECFGLCGAALSSISSPLMEKSMRGIQFVTTASSRSYWSHSRNAQTTKFICKISSPRWCWSLLFAGRKCSIGMSQNSYLEQPQEYQIHRMSKHSRLAYSQWCYSSIDSLNLASVLPVTFILQKSRLLLTRHASWGNHCWMEFGIATATLLCSSRQPTLQRTPNSCFAPNAC